MKKLILVALCLVGCYQEQELPPPDPIVGELFGLQNCEDETVSPYEFEGKVEFVRLFFVAEWCSVCTLVLESVYQEDVKKPQMAQMIILGQDLYEGAPTLATCASYAKSHNIPLDKIAIDPNWQATWKFLGIKTPGPEWFPWVAILTGEDVEVGYYNLLK